ncbi:Mcee [Phodopus roborovskii]|uniref:Mcee protein n=1 Tax=Phodopus roborovskii TaxID=109678 RepID=A0AAV0A8C7_PHORO|nr:Mcee [Phodopus roborovskii]
MLKESLKYSIHSVGCTTVCTNMKGVWCGQYKCSCDGFEEKEDSKSE